MRLLVVEDEKKLCDMIAKSLHQAGYEVDTCNDGEEALEMIKLKGWMPEQMTIWKNHFICWNWKLVSEV